MLVEAQLESPNKALWSNVRIPALLGNTVATRVLGAREVSV
jgi:hypothetical protein